VGAVRVEAAVGETMRGSEPGIIRGQELLGRRVRDRDGKKIGRVYDLETGHVDGALRVTALMVGAGSWISRFGWSQQPHGTRIPWQDITSLAPEITVRSAGED